MFVHISDLVHFAKFEKFELQEREDFLGDDRIGCLFSSF